MIVLVIEYNTQLPLHPTHFVWHNNALHAKIAFCLAARLLTFAYLVYTKLLLKLSKSYIFTLFFLKKWGIRITK